MDLIKLKAFCIIAKSGSFSRAAEELFVTQPAVSAQIHDLESIYETKLFERLGHKISLTEEGKALLPFAELIVKTLEESHFAVDDVRNSTAGIIRVGASILPGMYLLPEIISGFTKECPHISVLPTVALAAKIRGMIKKNELDVGIVGSYESKRQKSVLEEKQISEDKIVLIIGNEHNWRNRSSVNIRELVDEPLILPSKPALTRQFIEAKFKEIGKPLKIEHEFGNIEIIKRMVQKNLGVSILPLSAVKKEYENGWLKINSLSGFDLERRILLVYRKNRRISGALKKFLSYIEADTLENLMQ